MEIIISDVHMLVRRLREEGYSLITVNLLADTRSLVFG